MDEGNPLQFRPPSPWATQDTPKHAISVKIRLNEKNVVAVLSLSDRKENYGKTAWREGGGGDPGIGRYLDRGSQQQHSHTYILGRHTQQHRYSSSNISSSGGREGRRLEYRGVGIQRHRSQSPTHAPAGVRLPHPASRWSWVWYGKIFSCRAGGSPSRVEILQSWQRGAPE